MQKKKKHTVSPEAAKILEQYRNAGKPKAEGEDGADPAENGAPVPARSSTPPPGSAQMRRSGTRGK